SMAQSIEAAIRGRVIDTTGSAMAGASVSIAGRSTVTDAKGEVSLLVGPGTYDLRVEADGFLGTSQPLEIRRESVDIGEIRLQVAPVQYRITVTEAPGYLTTASSTATKTLTPLRDVPQSISVVSREQIRDQMMASIGDAVRYVPGITTH